MQSKNIAMVAFAVLASMGVAALSACDSQALQPAAASAPASPVDVQPAGSGADLTGLYDDIGSTLVISWVGPGLNPGVRSLIEDGRVGGVLLFSSNFNGPAGLKALTDQLAALAASACLDHPILVMLDEEGGQVDRVQAPFAPPSQLAAGQAGPAGVRSLEQASGAGLRTLGVGLNLAPVADVRTNARDSVIGDRSFGANPAVVAPLVAAAVQGLHAGGVGATLKHFPGLGGAAGDPHVAIPTDPETEATWESVQMPGFQAGISAGADAVMTTAVYVPGLGGAGTPAMFSAPVVGRLRSQLGFQGVIVSDSVSMGGISALWSLPDATAMALGAGNDLVLLGNGNPTYEMQAVMSVRAAALSGRLDRAQLHGAATRVNAMRDRWGRRVPRCRAPLTVT